jgi:hypothetical protein
VAEPFDVNEPEALRDLSGPERAIAKHSESLWRQAHQIAGDNPGVDPGDIYHALRCLEIDVVSLDLDVVIASNRLSEVESLLRGQFEVEPFPHSLNVSERDSDLRIQIQRDPRYSAFLERSTVRELLGLQLPVAAIEDLLQGKVWAAQDVTQRASKRQKDLADIARILERHEHLRSAVPADVLERLI